MSLLLYNAMRIYPILYVYRDKMIFHRYVCLCLYIAVARLLHKVL